MSLSSVTSYADGDPLTPAHLNSKLDPLISAISDSVGGVVSVFGRTGTVAAASSDYTFGQIGSTPTTLAGYGITDASNLTHTHAASDITTGTLAIARGGTALGTTPANGQLLIGNGTGYSLATIIAGTNILITNGAGTIEIAATGGGSGGTLTGSGTTNFLTMFTSATGISDSKISQSGDTVGVNGVLSVLTTISVGALNAPTAAIRLPAQGGVSFDSIGAYNNYGIRQGGSNELIFGTTFGSGLFNNKHLFYSGTDNSRYVEIEASQILGVGGVGALGSSGVPWNNVYANTITSYNRIDTKASVTGGSGFRVPHGVAPSAPTNGDIWTTTAGMYVRINGTTVGPLAAGGGGSGVTGSGTAGTLVRFSGTDTVEDSRVQDSASLTTFLNPSVFSSAVTINGVLAANGAILLGDSGADTLTVTARVASNIESNADTYQVGTSGQPFHRVYLGGGTPGLYVSGSQVVAARSTGWGPTFTQTASKTATLTGLNVAPSAIEDAAPLVPVMALEGLVRAMYDAMVAHGLIGS